MSRPCTFCEITAGRIPADLIIDSGGVVAFLDHRPLFPGHVLLVPREHVETLVDLPSAMMAPFFTAAQRLASAVEMAMKAQGTFVAINNRVSQSVPHLHVHIVPRTKGDGLKGFFWPRHAYADALQMTSTAQAIREALSASAGPRSDVPLPNG